MRVGLQICFKTHLADNANKIEILLDHLEVGHGLLQGQLTDTFPTDTYTLGQIFVYVGGVSKYIDVNFLENGPTSFTLLRNANEIPAGIEVVAIYR